MKKIQSLRNSQSLNNKCYQCPFHQPPLQSQSHQRSLQIRTRHLFLPQILCCQLPSWLQELRMELNLPLKKRSSLLHPPGRAQNAGFEIALAWTRRCLTRVGTLTTQSACVAPQFRCWSPASTASPAHFPVVRVNFQEMQ